MSCWLVCGRWLFSAFWFGCRWTGASGVGWRSWGGRLGVVWVVWGAFVGVVVLGLAHSGGGRVGSSWVTAAGGVLVDHDGVGASHGSGEVRTQAGGGSGGGALSGSVGRALRWGWPVVGEAVVVRGFDPPAAPWLAGHRGVDLAVGGGDFVRAAGAGVVSFAGPVAGRGVVVVAHPGGLRTTYMPVRPSVRRGERVAAGDVVGTVEPGAGHCPDVCLHWGLRRGTQYLDPLLLLGRGGFRLLPVGDRRGLTAGGQRGAGTGTLFGGL
ncbi:murein hydrolase activator EnvC family protein [Thermocatellispora tengchongensis]|uniref:murein hydrolase activator EnvC family protein n=1 Tax=Thermocatellispora tengchongensis TaxID=1073253 RepID=UPI0036252862